MPQSAVIPEAIACSIKPGEHSIRKFTIPNSSLPNGSITASLTGGDGLIRLVDLTSFTSDKEILSPEERKLEREEMRRMIGVNPDSPAIAIQSQNTVGPDRPLAVSNTMDSIEGRVEFTAPAQNSSVSANATVILRGPENWHAEVPVLCVVGQVGVAFAKEPIEVHQREITLIPVHVTLPPGSPAAIVTLTNHNRPEIWCREDIEVPAGGSVDAALAFHLNEKIPLGETAIELEVMTEVDTGATFSRPLRVVVIPPSTPPALDRRVAENRLRDYHVSWNGDFGRLGPALPEPATRGTDRYTQMYALGYAEAHDDGTVTGYTYLRASVNLAAAKCLTTDDPGDGDEIYIVLSVTTLDPDQAAVRSQTIRTNIVEGVTDGRIFSQGEHIATINNIVGTGLQIHAAVFDHEQGDAETLRSQIAGALAAATNQIAGEIVAANANEDTASVTDWTDFGVNIGGESLKVKDLFRAIALPIAKMFSDDLIGEHMYPVSTQDVLDIAKDHNYNLRTLEGDVQFNWPPRDAYEVVITNEGNDGSYKLYFTITPEITPPQPLPQRPSP